MTQHYNIKSQTEKRRLLRSHLFKAEAIIWKKLSRKQMLRYKFRRQHSIDRYVLDFYCPELKLAIEIDGDTHFRGAAEVYDKHRQEHIEHFGIQLLRFTNIEVYKNIYGVLQTISEKINQLQEIKKDKS